MNEWPLNGLKSYNGFFLTLIWFGKKLFNQSSFTVYSSKQSVNKTKDLPT